MILLKFASRIWKHVEIRTVYTQVEQTYIIPRSYPLFLMIVLDILISYKILWKRSKIITRRERMEADLLSVIYASSIDIECKIFRRNEFRTCLLFYHNILRYLRFSIRNRFWERESKKRIKLDVGRGGQLFLVNVVIYFSNKYLNCFYNIKKPYKVFPLFVECFQSVFTLWKLSIILGRSLEVMQVIFPPWLRNGTESFLKWHIQVSA